LVTIGRSEQRQVATEKEQKIERGAHGFRIKGRGDFRFPNHLFCSPEPVEKPRKLHYDAATSFSFSFCFVHLAASSAFICIHLWLLPLREDDPQMDADHEMRTTMVYGLA